MPEKINHNIMFQFYLSSIKSLTQAVLEGRKTGFNSTLVQLKEIRKHF